MGTDARGHTAPLPSEKPERNTINALSLSINDVIMVADATARAALLTTLANQTPSQSPTAARPIIVRQQDTGVYWQHNGTAWDYLLQPLMNYSWDFDRTGNPSDAYAAGAFAYIYGGSLPSWAPAGRYLITASANLQYGTASGSTAGNLRLLAGTTNLTGDMRCDLSPDLICTTVTRTYQHSGGALTVNVYHYPAGGSGGIAYSLGSHMTIVFLGP